MPTIVDAPPSVVLAAVHELLDSLSIEAFQHGTGAEQAAVAQSCMRLSARAKAFELAATRAVHESGEARRQGATSTGSLLAGEFGGDRKAADRSVKQAEQLAKATQTQQALAKGQISMAQAELITKTLEHLPESVTESQREACETQLLCDAPTMDLKQLSRRADRIADVFAPDDVDEIENETVEAAGEGRVESDRVLDGRPRRRHSQGWVRPPRGAGRHAPHHAGRISAPQVMKD